MALVSVIIPVYNKWNLTQDCLVGLAEHTPAGSLEIIVVDNASEDDTAAAAPNLGKRLFGDSFHYLRQERNLNFGPACNLGAERASHDLLFFLNNDTVTTEGWLLPLLKNMKEVGTAGVGPLLLYPDETVQHLGIIIDPPGYDIGHLYSHLPAKHPLCRKTRSFRAITGAALMVPKQRFRSVGGFYPEYVNGYEDVDLCLALSREGDRFRVVPESVVYHLESQTPNRLTGTIDNGGILSSRWEMRLYANMEEIALADGYRLEVTMPLSVMFAPGDERLPRLLASLPRQGGRPDLDKMAQTLIEEPFWEEGYLLLAQYLENMGELEAAISTVHLSLLVNPGFRGASRVMDLIRKLPAGEMKAGYLSQMGPLYQGYLERIMDEEGHTRKLRTAIAFLESQGKRGLADQYRAAGKQAVAFRLNSSLER